MAIRLTPATWGKHRKQHLKDCLVMAQNYTQILTELGQNIAPKVVSQINRTNVLAALLKEEPAYDAVCTWDVRMGTETPTTAVIADGADVSVFNDDTIKKAFLEYGTYHDGFQITDKQMSAAGVMSNPNGLFDYFEAKLMESAERLARATAKDAITGAGGADRIHGLLAAGAPAIGATGVYAGIDRAVGGNAQFRGNALAVAATPALSASHLRSADMLVYAAAGTRCDVWLMNPVNFNQYGDALGANRRYIQDVYKNDGSTVKMDGGYRVLEFDGAAVIMDKLIPAGTVIGLDTQSMAWSQLSANNVTNAIFSMGGTRMLNGGAERQLDGKSSPLTAYLKKLANGGNANKFALYCYPQLKVKQPNRNVIITGLLST
jgi:hypothetical protein